MTPNLSKTVKMHWKALLFAIATLLFFYVFLVSRSNGWFAWSLALPPAVIIIITAWCRVTDIAPNRIGWHWQARKVGLVLSGSGAAAVISAPFTEYQLFPSWEVLVMMWGFALAWLTTPNMVPWWKYITGTAESDLAPGADS